MLRTGESISVALSPLYQQWVMRTNLAMVSGRVVSNNNNGRWMGVIGPQVVTDGPVSEKITASSNGLSGSLTYSYKRTRSDTEDHKEVVVEFGLEINSEGRFVLRYSDKDEPQSYFELSQFPGMPISLSLPPAGKPRVLQAPTIWQLLVVNESDCRKKFLPLLEATRPDWHLASTASAAEDELVKLSAVAQRADRRQWAAWLAQLGDPRSLRRERADRKLREVGPVVLGYLGQLDMNRLDAEQQFRVRRIIHDLSSQQGEDTPESVAAMLIGDPYVWLALLSRDDEAKRQAAVQQLEVFLNAPVHVDPKADPASQAGAREELRQRIDMLRAANAQSEDGSPHGGK